MVLIHSPSGGVTRVVPGALADAASICLTRLAEPGSPELSG